MARVLKGSQFYLHTHTFIRNRNEPYLPLPSQPHLVLICRPRRDRRLSRPWCEAAQTEMGTCNLSIANPALYHTATSARCCTLTYCRWVWCLNLRRLAWLKMHLHWITQTEKVFSRVSQ